MKTPIFTTTTISYWSVCQLIYQLNSSQIRFIRHAYLIISRKFFNSISFVRECSCFGRDNLSRNIPFLFIHASSISLELYQVQLIVRSTLARSVIRVSPPLSLFAHHLSNFCCCFVFFLLLPFLLVSSFEEPSTLWDLTADFPAGPRNNASLYADHNTGGRILALHRCTLSALTVEF